MSEEKKGIKLSVLDRMLLPAILPKKGGLVTMMTTRHLLKEIDFSAEEVKNLGLRENGEEVIWDPKKETILEVEITPAMEDLIKQALSQVDKDQNVSLDMVPLLEKIEAL